MAQSRTPRNRGRTFSWFVLLLAGTWPRFLRQVGVPTQPCPPSLAFPQAPAPGGHTSPVALVLAGGAAAVRAAMCAACVVPARAGTWFRVPAPGGRTTVPVLAGGAVTGSVLRWPGWWGWPRRGTRSRRPCVLGHRSARVAASSGRQQRHSHSCQGEARRHLWPELNKTVFWGGFCGVPG